MLPPQQSQLHLDAIVKALHVSKPRQKTDPLKILQRVAEAMPRPRAWSIIFSDLLCDREPLFKGLEMLRHRRHDVMVFHIMDDDELTFPFAGTTRFEGMEELPHLLCDPRRLRDGLPGGAGRVPGRGPPRVQPDRAWTTTLVRTSDYLDAVLSQVPAPADGHAVGRGAKVTAG